MAKMFYTLDETRTALGKSEDEIKQFVRDGRLREFRDGPRQMFKADQVEGLKSTIGSDPLGLSEESGAPLSLADTGGTGAPMTLADSVASGVSSGSGLAGISGSGLGSGLTGGTPGSGMMNLREDTALAADLGLSGTGLAGSVDSLGGIPSPGRSSGGSIGGGSLGGSVGGLGGTGLGGTGLAGSGLAGGSGLGGSLGGSAVGGSLGGTGAGSVAGSAAGTSAGGGTRSGINVFGEESHFAADPMAATAAPGLGGGDLNLEGVGSGSGLLDLTRETDDTSLGADIIGEIGPGKSSARPLRPEDTGGSVGGITLDAPRGGIVRGTTGVTIVEARDPWATAFGAFALGGAIVLLLAGFALLTSMYQVRPPDLIAWFSDKTFFIILAMAAAVAIVCGAFGKLVSMSTGR